jgi:catechol 2,3-dioxygenase-like lactoylglutathione lyase family enzyme
MMTRYDLRRLHGNKPARQLRIHRATAIPPREQVRQLEAVAEHCANEPAGFFRCGESWAPWSLAARVAAVFVLALFTQPGHAAVREVGAIGLTVGDLDQARKFYTQVLPFREVAVTEARGREQDALLGLSGARTRTAELRLGDERITLTEHLAKKGRPIPADSRSFDHWFQHIAIVVSDMDRAYEHLRRHKVKHVSTAPQTLPAWNKDAGGIKAFYFRDPEDHVLEIIWFPPGKGDPKWQSVAGRSRREEALTSETGNNNQSLLTSAPTEASVALFLGIDHTAIVVSDTERSLAFYRDALGLKITGGAENHGTEQEHLNQVFGARLRITALRAERGPGIEFLEYITPPGGRPLPPDAKANDLVFWHTRLLADDGRQIAGSLRERGARFVSRSPREAGAHSSFIVRDPDGHALHIEPRASAAFSRN